MNGQLLQFVGSLAAVTALVVVTWLLGFRQPATLSSEAEARDLFRLAPGGFEPIRLGLDAQGRSAIAADEAGRKAVLVPHGNQFVFRQLSPASRIDAVDGRITIAGLPNLALELGEEAKRWATTDIGASNS